MRTIFFCALFILSACGKFEQSSNLSQSNRTTVTFGTSQNSFATSAVLVSGIMIYIGNPDMSYVQTLALSDETLVGGYSLSLPNGQYQVIAMGWDGASPFSVSASGLRCAKTDPFTLSGTPTTINLTMTNAKCGLNNSGGGTMFPANANSQSFSLSTNVKNAYLHFCASSVLSGTGGAGSRACSTSTGDTDFIASNYSQVELVGHVRNGTSITRASDESQTLYGTCRSNYAAGVLHIGNFPLGNPNDVGIFAARVKIYSNATCSGDALETINFPKGIAFASTEFGSPIELNAFTGAVQVFVNHGN
jgi:hypothetical protein